MFHSTREPSLLNISRQHGMRCSPNPSTRYPHWQLYICVTPDYYTFSLSHCARAFRFAPFTLTTQPCVPCPCLMWTESNQDLAQKLRPCLVTKTDCCFLLNVIGAEGKHSLCDELENLRISWQWNKGPTWIKLSNG